MAMRYPLNPKRPPLNAHELDPTDPATREARAILELLRTLNVGKLVAYTGSGISTIYGYDSWSDLALHAARSTIEAVLPYLTDAENGAVTRIQNEIGAVLSEIIYRNMRDSEKLLADDELLALVNALLTSIQCAEAPKDQKKIVTDSESIRKISEEVANESQMSDGLPGQIRKSVEKFLGGKVGLKAMPAGAVKCIREAIGKPFRRRWNFPVNKVKKILKSKGFSTRFLEHLNSASLLPRDLIPAIRLVVDDEKIGVDAPTESKRLNSSRGEIDPLHILIRDFKINRFATLNYDIEIEACLEDLDYPYDTLTCQDRAGSRTGAASTSITLRPDNTPELVTFAAKPTPSPPGYHVVHIHGSIKQPDSMVVTQDHYNQLYVAPSRYAATFRDALHLMFNGNSILFLGVGLSEDDIMRPIRNSLTENMQLPLYTLLASDTSMQKNLAKIQQNKARYGINTIVYGRRTNDIPAAWHSFSTSLENPTETRLNKKHGLVPSEIIPLHEELQNLVNLAGRLPQDSPGLVKALCSIVTRENIALYPRLCSSRYFDFLSELEVSGWNPPENSKNRITKFIRSTLYSVVISQACCDVLSFMKKQAKIWRLQWTLPETKPASAPNAHAYHGIDVDVNSSPTYLNAVREAAEKKLGLPFDLSNLKAGLRILRIKKGGGKGSLFAAVARFFEDKGTAGTNYAFSASSTLRFDVLESMISAIDAERTGRVSYVFIHNAESLMDRRHLSPYKRAVNHATEMAFRKLVELSKDGRVFLVVTCTNQATEDYFLALARSVLTEGELAPQGWAEPDPKIDIPAFCNAILYAATGNRAPLPYPCDSLWLNSFRAKMLSQSPPVPAPDEGGLKARIDAVDPNHRSSVVIEMMLSNQEDEVLRSGVFKDRVVKVLQQVLMKWLFAFNLPTGIGVLKQIPEVTKVLKSYRYRKEQKIDRLLDETLTKMCKLLLAFEMRDGDGVNHRKRYILHNEAGHYLAHQRGLSFKWVNGREWSTLTLSNVLMDREPLLSQRDYEDSCELFSRLVEQDDRECVRSAYGLLRGNLFLSNVMRAGLDYWGQEQQCPVLEQHLQRLLRLRACFAWPEGESPPLYPCDHVWILNEIAVVCHLRGQFHDAILLWRELEKLDGDEAGVATICRIKLNLSACLIERGQFSEAAVLLHDVEIRVLDEMRNSSPSLGFAGSGSGSGKKIALPDGTSKAADSVHPELLLLYALSQGYLAQLKMLGAKMEQARQQIDHVLEWSGSLDVAGLRGWLHYQAALIHAGCGDDSRSTTQLELAMSLARSAQRPDLILGLEINETEVEFRRGPPGDFEALHRMLRGLDNCRLRADQLGSDRLRVAAAIVRTRIMLAMSQTEGARHSVLDAICLSMRNGMRLRRISSLTLLCALMALRDEKEGALKVLTEVRESAESMRYIRGVLDLDRLEHALKLGEGVQAWARNASDSAPYLEREERGSGAKPRS